MGGSKISMPQPTSSVDAVKEWVSSMPQVYETQMKYAPQEAAQQVALAQQYAEPLGQAYLTAQKAMYPEQYALQEELMSKARAGMAEGMPEWAKQSYLDTMRGNLGTNVGSPIGADYTSRGLLQQQNQWQQYYQNMALSLSGSQPIYQAQSPTTSNYMSNFTPSSVLGYTAQNYGSYANAYSNMNRNSGSPWGSILGTIGGGLLGSFTGGLGTAAGMALGNKLGSSSIRYKQNIKLWA